MDSDDYVDSDYVEYLYGLVRKYNVPMSICQHRVHYNSGTVKDLSINTLKGVGLTQAEECIERMLYHDVIDTSAWAKLYDRNLFTDIRYPYGKIYEDIATTYKLMMKCPVIAVGSEAKYNYIIHKSSIVNSDFTPAKLDLLEMTDNMAEDVVRAYPGLDKAALRRRVYARFSTLNQMLNTDECQEEKKEIIRFIKKNAFNVLTNSKAPLRDKAAIILLTINYRLYRFFWLRHMNRIMNKN